MNYAMVVDSSSGLSKEEAEKKGWYFLPLIIDIDGKTYLDGIDINSKNLYEIWTDEQDVKTGTTPPKYSLDLLEKLSKNFDKVIVYPISQHLSSQYNNLTVISKNLKNVKIIKSNGVAEIIPYELEQFEDQLKKGNITVEQGIALLEEKNKASKIYLVPKNMKALVKGGRVSPALAKLAKLLNIVAIIIFEKGKLEKHGKGRLFRKSISKLVVKKNEEIPENELDLYDIVLFHSMNNDYKSICKEVEVITNKKVRIVSIPPVVAIHTGKEAVGIGFLKKTNFDLITQYIKPNKK